MSVGKGTFIHEVAKDRLWRDYVAREENHQNYWAVEAQYVKGSLSPEKKSILRNVEAVGTFDASVLLGTAGKSQQQQSLHNTATGAGGPLTITTNSNPNAPSNLLLRQLHMTAAENEQNDAKVREQLKNYKNCYSTRASAAAQLKGGGEDKKGATSDSNNNNNATNDAAISKNRTTFSPNSTFGASNSLRSPPQLSPNATMRGIGVVEKERTLNNSYCSHLAGEDIGIHHYKYSPPARSCQGFGGGGSDTCTATNNNNGTVRRPVSLPPLAFNNTASLNATAASYSSGSGGAIVPSSSTNRSPHSPFNTSRANAHTEELEAEAALVSPNRPYTEHGMLYNTMGLRIAPATGRRGYGQRIASTNDEVYALRPTLELNERTKHGFRKWN